ncbi:MAG: hypothetical protein ACXV3U_06695 [Halobacteriota archaeon]
MVEAELPDAVVAFQDMLCDACMYSNDGECVKDDVECPVATVKRSYRRGGKVKSQCFCNVLVSTLAQHPLKDIMSRANAALESVTPDSLNCRWMCGPFKSRELCSDFVQLAGKLL